MIEIRIITTEGCEGCKIINNIATNAADFINEHNNKQLVKVTSTDCLDESIRQFANRYQVNDYPATFIMDGIEVKDRIFGTCTEKTLIDSIEDILIERIRSNG